MKAILKKIIDKLTKENITDLNIVWFIMGFELCLVLWTMVSELLK